MHKATILFFLVVLVLSGFGYFMVRATDNASEIAQAQAFIESARAAQEAAKAAQIANRGLSTVSTMQTVILAGIVFSVLAAIGLSIYLVLERKQAQRRTWAPGPNAGWRRVGEEKAARQLPQGDPLNQMVQLILLQYLTQMQKPTSPPPQIETVETSKTDDDFLWG